MAHMPLPMTLYRGVMLTLSPLAPAVLLYRRFKGKEDATRMWEKLGRASVPRPDGKLIWIHGASVGETLAALPLIDRLLEDPALNVLVTSGTLTSAKLLDARLPERAIHQFVPLDTPWAVRRFLNYWKPDIGLFVDSDIWPNLITGARERNIPLAVVNARMSERSAHRWAQLGISARWLFSQFSAVLAQDGEIAARFRLLGATEVQITGSLKADAAPPEADPRKLATLQDAIGVRPVLLAAQTHAGEEETLLPASDALRRQFPNLLTIIIPRHITRAADIVSLCGDRRVVRRSTGDTITADTEIYIADTMGEMGLFYRLSRFAFVGGSLIAHGGQNPLEPAKLHCAVLAGPSRFNFKTAYQAIFDAQGLGEVRTAHEIAERAADLLTHPEKASDLGDRAAAGGGSLTGATDKTVLWIKERLNYAGA